MSNYTYVYIPMYTPEYSPVEQFFEILKSKWKRHKSRKSIDWGKKEGLNLIRNEIKSINSWQIVGIWRNFINRISSGLKQMLSACQQ